MLVSILLMNSAVAALFSLSLEPLLHWQTCLQAFIASILAFRTSELFPTWGFWQQFCLNERGKEVFLSL